MVTFLRSQFYKILAVFVILTAPAGLHAQVKFSAVCGQKKIGKNDLLQVSFKVENATHVETIIPPSFKNFSIASGPNQESGMTSINGKTNQYIAISFYLQPKSIGKFTIGSATARADGKEFSSAPINVEVTNESTVQSNNNSRNSLSPFAGFNFDFPSAPATHQFDDYILKPGEKPEDKVKKNLFIRLDVSKTSCYVGEPIIASFKLYTRLRSESTITGAPSFNGFSVNDLDVKNNGGGIEKFDGRQYNVYTLRKVQLYPLQPGDITLDPLVADNKVSFIKSEYANSQNGDRFYDMLENFADATSPQDAVVEQNVVLKSKPVNITVKPLPVENKPDDFKGGVGNFSIQSSLEKNKISTDDAGNLRVIISGQGNIQLVNAPKIKWPAGIDGYDAKVTDNVDKTAVPMKGSKVFTFPFTVSKEGNYKIDSISFSYFDPSSSSYKTVRTAPLMVNVIKGTGASNNRYLKNTTASNTNTFVPTTFDLLAATVLLSAIVLIFLLWLSKRNKSKDVLVTKVRVDDLKNSSEEKLPEFIIPENTLLAAHEKLVQQDGGEFYRVLDQSLKKYLSAKFKVPAEELNKKRINEELDRCNVGLGTSLLLNSLLEEIEINRYAPASDVNHLKDAFEKASEVVSLLDKQCAEKYYFKE
ncbi:MAG TPA: BatD family protein [Hanamia sp.]|nr:BatD family protein [Hanamia sp.]